MIFTDLVTYELPERFFRVTGGSFDLVTSGSISQSSYIPLPRSAGVPMQRWSMEVSLAPLGKADAAAFRGWRARLNGVASAFTAYDPVFCAPFASATHPTSADREIRFTHPDNGARSFARDFRILEGVSLSRVAENAPRYADNILIDGLPASQPILGVGDLFGLGGNLYMATRDAASNAAGETRLFFAWKLHKGAAIGETVNFRKPRARFVLTGHDGLPLSMSGLSPNYSDGSIKAIEVPFCS